MRKSVLGILVFAAMLITAVAGVGRPTVLLYDDLESHVLGALPIGSSDTWCYLDTFSGPSDWPRVEIADDEHGQVLHFSSLGANSRQQVGAIISIPALRSDEVLELSFDLFLNSSSRYFRLNIRDMFYRSSGAIGCTTGEPRAPVFTLADVTWNGNLMLGVSSPTDSAEPGGPRDEAICDANLLKGQWYVFRLVHAPGLLELYIDGEKVGELQNSAYDLSEEQDWMLLLGDASSNSPWVSDVLVDNLLLQVLSSHASQEEQAEDSPPASTVARRTLAVPGDYPTIQEAIDAAADGDAIVVAAGTYTENIVISGEIQLRGESDETLPVLEPSAWDTSIITVEPGSAVYLRNLAVQYSYGIAIQIENGAETDVLDCVFSENEMDMHLSGESSARVSGCRFSDFYQYSIQLEDQANLFVSNCYFEVPVELDAISAQGSGNLVVSDTTFIAFVPNLYEEFVGGIVARGPTSLVATNCTFDGLGMGVHGGDYRYFSVRSCTFKDGLFGVHGLGRSSEPWELAEIVDCTFKRMGQPIKLYGEVGLIDISRNSIKDTTEGPAIGLCLEVCGGCPHGIPPFVGEITGEGNIIDDGNRRSCPPYRAPFWPDGFLAD